MASTTSMVLELGHLPGSPSLDELLPDETFDALRSLIREESGIQLNGNKKAFLVRRLSKHAESIGKPKLTDYVEHLCTPHNELERQTLLDLVSTNETSFFREPQQFAFLRDQLLPELLEMAATNRHLRQISVWSASCSTGQEPYSVAMTLCDVLPSSWLIRIEATDLSNRALEKARAGRYSMKDLEQVPEEMVRPYLLRGRDENEGLFCISPEIRSLVHFERANLTQEPFPVAGTFDLLLCRNTLMYFDEETKRRVIENLIQHVRIGGYLFLGHAESLSGHHAQLDPVSISIFRRKQK